MKLLSGFSMPLIVCILTLPLWAQSSEVETPEELEIRLCTGDIRSEADLVQAAKRCSPEQLEENLKGISVIQNEIHDLNEKAQQSAYDTAQKLSNQIEKLSKQIEVRESHTFQISEGLLDVLSLTGFSTVMIAGVAKAGTNLKAAGQNGYYVYQLKKDRASDKAHQAFEKRRAMQTTKLNRLMKIGAISWLLAAGGGLINELNVHVTVDADELDSMRQHLELLKTQYAVRKLNLISVQSAQNSITTSLTE